MNIIKLAGFEDYASGFTNDHDNIILHSIADMRNKDPYELETIKNLFHEYRVSCNYLITRDGVVYEIISPEKIAWHAGKSEYNGVTNLNKNSIGIELAGSFRDTFEQAQYDSLIDLCVFLHTKFGITPQNIKGHQIVSDSGVRSDPKPDPGRYFDWLGFGYGLITKILKQAKGV